MQPDTAIKVPIAVTIRLALPVGGLSRMVSMMNIAMKSPRLTYASGGLQAR